jgi:hypothetical protein
MSTKATASPIASGVSRGSWTLIVSLGFAMLAAVTFWIVAALPYLNTNRETFGSFPEAFWDRRYGLWLHIAGGKLALFTGPLQLWLGDTGLFGMAVASVEQEPKVTRCASLWQRGVRGHSHYS